MSIFHSRVTAASPRRRAPWPTAEFTLKICTALLVTFVTAAVLLRVELYLSGLARISNLE
jgi:hypothetical protein